MAAASVGVLRDASGKVVIVVPGLIRMTVAMVLRLMSYSVAARRVERVENHDAIEGDADLSRGAARGSVVRR